MKNRLKQSVLIAFLYLGIAMLSLNLTSCEEGGIDSQAATGLKVGVGAQNSYTVTALAPGDITFNITSNTPWTIHSDQDWCQVTPVSSTVSALVHDITVTTEINMDNKPRTAVLTITGEGVADQTVTITQDAKLDFEVSMFEISQLLDRTGEIREFRIASNKPWTLSSDKAWLTFDKTSGEGGEEVNVIRATAEVNNGNLRRATITVKSDVEEKTYVVTQDGNQLEVVYTEAADTNFNGVYGSHVYQVNANLAWSVEIAPEYDWLHVTSGATGDNTRELTIRMDHNSKFIARTGKVVLKPVTPIPGMENVVIPIHQAVPYWIDGGVVFEEDGSATLTSPGSGNNRIVTNNGFKLGTFIWKFKSFDPNGVFNLNAWPFEGNTNFNMNLGANNTKHSFGWGGNFQWQEATLDITGKDVVDLEELKLDIDHDPDHEGMLKFTVYFNGEQIMSIGNKPNKFADELAAKGIPFYFGYSGSPAATCVIESFTVIPRE